MPTTTERVVVGVEKANSTDWVDAYGHYWAWDKAQGLWVHDRPRCSLNDGQICEPSKR